MLLGFVLLLGSDALVMYGLLDTTHASEDAIYGLLMELAILCFWWPLFRRRYLPMKVWSVTVTRAMGVASTIVIVALGILSAQWGMLVEFLPTFAGHIAIGVYLFWKPRLLLPWSVTILVVTPGACVIGLILIPMFMLQLLLIGVFYAPVLGVVPAWWFSRRKVAPST